MIHNRIYPGRNLKKKKTTHQSCEIRKVELKIYEKEIDPNPRSTDSFIHYIQGDSWTSELINNRDDHCVLQYIMLLQQLNGCTYDEYPVVG